MDARTAGSIDVVIAAWNSAGTIARAVRSVLADPAVRRVIVIDDASSDATAAAARDADDGSHRLVVERLAANAGPAAARNRAMALGDAEWIAILDADDFVEDGRMGRLLHWAADADFVADDPLQVREDELDRVAPAAILGVNENWTLSFEQFVEGNISVAGRSRKELGFLKPIMRRAFLAQHGLAYIEHLRLGEDFALYAAALLKGARFRIVPAQGYVAVVREGSLSGNHSQQDLINLRDHDHLLMEDDGLTPAEMALLARHYRSLDARIQWLEVIAATKARDLRRGLAPFLRSADVSSFLVQRLSEQIWLRSRRALLRSR
ncbi:MAG: glycosyltransferase family 2 protein [Hyphomicrobiales bacterium]|nr:MAG: glycosyltransferase family 2 protein [Hyphomicrobiales bacterium]